MDLEPVEAVHLAQADRIHVEDADGDPVPVAELYLRAARRQDGFPTRYVVYRDLRDRGHMVQPPADPDDDVDLHLYPRGGFPGRTPSDRHVMVAGGSGALHPAHVLDRARRARDLDKRLLVAVVDGEGDLTYYLATPDDPTGEVPPDTDALDGTATLVDDRVHVLDDTLAQLLRAREAFGHPLEPGLQLALAEARWLHHHRDLTVRDPDGAALDDAALEARARDAQADADLRYAAYADLKDRGLVPKTGFKYGTHFRVYRTHPDDGHAPFLVHAVAPDRPLPWPEASGHVRLAHSVRKTLLLAVVPAAGGPPAYLRIKRTRP